MGNILALTSKDRITPVPGLESISILCEQGKNSTATGVLLKNLGGPFLKMKKYPILSGIFTREGLRKLDIFMLDQGFMTKYKITFKIYPEKRDGMLFIIRVYDLPNYWEQLDKKESDDKLMEIRKIIKERGKEKNDMTVFSFWPDTITLKDNSHPLEFIDTFEIHRKEFEAKTILISVDKTEYNQNMYGFCPTFTHGYATINTNGICCEKNREFLNSGKKSYQCSNNCETITELVRYACSFLALDIKNVKHVLYPLRNEELKKHNDSGFLSGLKQSCRRLSLDGPECLAGLTPDDNLFLIKDPDSITPGIIGKEANFLAFASDISVLDTLMPCRNKDKDYFPKRNETVIFDTNSIKMNIYNQLHSF